MRAVITRDMTVMGDNGTIIHFTKSTSKKPFEEISQPVYGRLVRAGAAIPYLPLVVEQNLPKRKRGKK